MSDEINKEIFVSIIILVHNAPAYIKKALKSLRLTQDVKYEVIVVDNGSDKITINLLSKLFIKKLIDKLICLKENAFFSKGNNIGSKLCSLKSTHILLLNSDVEIRNPFWLKTLLSVFTNGVASFGYCSTPPFRADGYCFLIDKFLYQKYLLDETYEWIWSITKLQAQLLRDGYDIIAIDGHDNYLFHFGGKSGNDWSIAKGLDVDYETVLSWFENTKNKVKRIDFGSKVQRRTSPITSVKRKLKSYFEKSNSLLRNGHGFE